MAKTKVGVWILCDSSNVHSFRWMGERQHPLQVCFKDRKTGGPGKVYGYNVNEHVFHQMEAAQSKGLFVNTVLKDSGIDCVEVPGGGR